MLLPASKGKHWRRQRLSFNNCVESCKNERTANVLIRQNWRRATPNWKNFTIASTWRKKSTHSAQLRFISFECKWRNTRRLQICSRGSCRPSRKSAMSSSLCFKLQKRSTLQLWRRSSKKNNSSLQRLLKPKSKRNADVNAVARSKNWMRTLRKS